MNYRIFVESAAPDSLPTLTTIANTVRPWSLPATVCQSQTASVYLGAASELLN